MGGANQGETKRKSSFSSTAKIVNNDPTMVMPELDEVRQIIQIKAGELDLDITRSQRGSRESELSLILAACKNISPTLLVRYFLVYCFYIGKYADKNSNRLQYKKLFLELVSHSCGDPAELQMIQQLRSSLDQEQVEAKQNVMLISYALKSKFILEAINKVLLLSKDPKDLVYFIYPVYALNSGIKDAFYKGKSRYRKDPLWIVAVLEDREIDLLNKMEGKENFFFFAAFMRGFSDTKLANEEFRAVSKANKGKTFLFTINFPHEDRKLNRLENNGFYVLQEADTEVKRKGDVLFNIMSSFKLAAKTDTFEYDLEYGELAHLEYAYIEQRYLGKQPVLMKMYQLCRGVSRFYLKSQSCLFRIISNNQDSLGVSHLILSESKNTINPVNDIERENLVNTHIEKGELDQAYRIADERNSLIFKAKKIQILFQRGDFEKVKQELAKVNEEEKKGKENLQGRLIVELVAARLQIREGQFKKARDNLNELYSALRKAYPGDFEYLGREVVVAIKQCEKRGSLGSVLQKVEQNHSDLYEAIITETLQMSSLSIKNK